jgi:hypothetical protein
MVPFFLVLLFSDGARLSDRAGVVAAAAAVVVVVVC